MLNEDIKKEVKEQLAGLEGEVKLVVFTQKIECRYCEDNRNLAQEIAVLSDRISVDVYNFLENKQKAEEYNIDKIPAIAVIGKKDYGIRFFGIPTGYEFKSLLEAIKLASSGNTGLSDETRRFLDTLEKDVHLQVFVTPTCPYCPSAVILAHRLACYSDRVGADMVEVSEFPHLGTKYEVQGVPLTVINETVSQVGAAPEPMLVEKIKNAVE